VEGSTQPGPTFSLVYATPLLQHQAQFDLNPALHGRLSVADEVGPFNPASGSGGAL